MKNKIKFLTKVVPTRFSKQISNIWDKCRSCLHSPHVLRVPSRRRASAHRSGAPLLRRPAPVSRLPARTGAALPCLSATLEGRVSRQHAQSVLTRPAARPFPPPCRRFPIRDSLLPAARSGGVATPGRAMQSSPQGFPPARERPELPPSVSEFQHLLGIFWLPFEGT